MIRVLVKPLNNAEYKELELLKDSVKIPLNESLMNLENPLNYTTEFSKTVSFPLTAINRKIFGEYVELDSLVTDIFSPADPIPVIVMDGSDIIIDGWFKLTTVDLSKHQIEGNIYGMMNQFFNKLKNTKFGVELPELLTSNCVIDRNIVYDSWMQDKNTRTLELKYPGETGHHDIDIIGFAPTTQGQPDQFDSESTIWGQTTTSSSNHYTASGGPNVRKYWESFDLPDNEATQAGQILKAPSERQTAQYRSYCQKPYVYVNKLLQLFQREAHNITDVDFVLDTDFFNENNSLYTDVVYTLPNLVTETSDSDAHIDVQVPVNSSCGPYNAMQSYGCFNRVTTGIGPVFTTNAQGSLQCSGTVKVTCEIDYSSGGGGTGRYAHFNNQAGVIYRVKLCHAASGSTIYTQDIKYCYTTCNESSSNVIYLKHDILLYPQGYSDGGIQPTGSGTYRYKYKWIMKELPYNFHFENLAANTQYQIKIDSVAVTSGAWTLGPNQDSGATNTCGGQWASGSFWVADNMQPAALQNITNIRFTTQFKLKAEYSSVMSKRSGSSLSMERLWSQSDPTPFEVIVKYAKLNNLVFDYNKENRRVTLMTRQKYFANSRQNILDWTDKIDWSKGMQFTPLQWDTQYICFNYDDADIDRLKDFQDKYGFSYGSKKIKTKYKFNTDTKDLLGEKNDNIYPSATISEYLYDTKKVKRLVHKVNGQTQEQTVNPELSNEYFIINRKGDKAANVSNSFYFRNWNEYWDQIGYYDCYGRGGYTEFESPLIFITDDSEYELAANTFCTQLVWREQSPGYATTGTNLETPSVKAKVINRTGNTIPCRPALSEYSDDMQNCILFSVPREDYFNPSAVYYKNAGDRYSKCWESYINEVYSEQNKKVTCQVWLTAKDWYEFATNKYIKINNVIYIVQAIKDYTPGIDTTTKVELLQVWDPDSYSN